MSSRADKAEGFFLQGYNCAQSVFLAFADKYGISQEQAAKIASSFGAGMGRMREVCGTVSGMLLVAGLETGSDNPEDKAKNYQIVQDLMKTFKEAHGSIYCKELLGLKSEDIGSPIPEKRTKEYYQKRPCKDLVRYAAELLEKKLDNSLHDNSISTD